MTESDIEIDDLPSRSQLKRDSQELRDLGEQLVLMANSHLEKITLDSSLLAAIKEARRLKNLDARRRQIQYIGKLMRNIDLTEIRYSIDKLNHQSQTFRQHFAMLEQWRDRLIDEGNSAVEEFLIDYPNADRQKIRNLSRQASREKTGSAKTKLFKYLKELAD
ncbi:MAG: ribosome biogenesis factor YjgA [Porticoccaceae bacterium]|jgi:ribosome-associated protein